MPRVGGLDRDEKVTFCVLDKSGPALRLCRVAQGIDTYAIWEDSGYLLFEAEEGVKWIRGHFTADTRAGAALIAARVLT